jgi:hypothetical protein
MAHGRLLSEKINREQECSMADMPDAKTGLFHRKSTDDYVVLWQGREICRYATMEAFVEAHADGLESLEANQAELLASYYK